MSVSFLSLTSINVYVLSYVLTTIGAFGVVTLMSSPYNNQTEAESLADYRGLFWRRPILTATLTVMMLSLAGIPLTAGFIGKFMLIMTMVSTQHWFFAAIQPSVDAEHNWGQQAGGIMVLFAAFLVILLGVYPNPMIELVKGLEILSPLQIILAKYS